MARAASDQSNAPGFSFLTGIIHFVSYFLVGPSLLWLVLVIVVPVLFGLAGKGDRYLSYLAWVEEMEARVAHVLSPELTLDGKTYLYEGWPYKSARNLAVALIPDAKKGFFVDDSTEYEMKQTQFENDRAAEQGYTNAPGRGGQTAMLAKASAYFEDRFYPTNKIMIGITGTRAIYALATAILIFPWLITGWIYGAYLVRRKDEMGEMHLGNRYRFYYRCAMFLTGVLPVLIVLPLPAPGIAIAAVTLIPLPYVVMMGRAHYVTRL